MDKWNRLKIRLTEDKITAINARQVAKDIGHDDLYILLKGKAEVYSDILRLMEEMEGDSNDETY